MLPISASASSSDQTSQTSGPAPQASAPVFSVTHQIGEGNTSNPTSSAAATASNGPAPSSGALPTLAIAVAIGLGVAALAGVLIGRRGGAR